MSASFDLVILGGGCAGLSLASRLSALGSKCPKVAIVESRSDYQHDRSWCFFKDPEAPAPALQTAPYIQATPLVQKPGANNSPPAEPSELPSAQHAWQSMRITTATSAIVIDCGAMPYQMLHSGQFYRDAQDAIAQTGQLKLLLGTSVANPPTKRGELWQVDTSAGLLQSRYVVDTRPVKRPEIGGATLWQSFYGQEIECAVDVFDAACGDLMDFSAAEQCGGLLAFPDAVSFVYVLPMSPRRALIEFTVFGPSPLSPDAFYELQAKAVAQRVGNKTFAVVRTEHGILPMGVKPAPPSLDSSYIFAGLTAGGARPSSGYAFARIQRWAQACADAIAIGNPPVGHAADGVVLRAMDALFLKVVRAHPHVAPDLFLALFAGANTRRVIQFLSDRASLADYAAVVAALLPKPLLRALAGQRSVKLNRAVAFDEPHPIE